MNPRLFLILNLLLTLMGLMGVAQAQQDIPPLDATEKTEVIDSISKILIENYVFPDVAKEIVSHLEKKENKGLYNDVSDPHQFAEMLSEDVRSINNDLHLRVRFAPEMIKQQKDATTPEDSMAIVQQRIRRGKMNNFGFQKIEFLEGNVGYLNLTGFSDTEFAGETATAAMNYLSNSDALIIDLRQNGGGSPNMIQLITSYLYGPEPVHLNNFYWRPQDLHTQTWTLPYVPGNRRPDMPVYILTSKQTFSAAEEFSYNLRNLERATLVGETTGGGAHPGGTRIATDRYTIWVPSGKAINPITNDNWEGVGVKPHVEVQASHALEKAQILALQSLMENSKADEKGMYKWSLDGLLADQNTFEVDETLLEKYVGNYGTRQIKLEQGILYYQRKGRAKYALSPMSENIFKIDDLPYFRMKFLEEAGKVIAIQGMYQDGHSDKSIRDTKS